MSGSVCECAKTRKLIFVIVLLLLLFYENQSIRKRLSSYVNTKFHSRDLEAPRVDGSEVDTAKRRLPLQALESQRNHAKRSQLDDFKLWQNVRIDRYDRNGPCLRHDALHIRLRRVRDTITVAIVVWRKRVVARDDVDACACRLAAEHRLCNLCVCVCVCVACLLWKKEEKMQK